MDARTMPAEFAGIDTGRLVCAAHELAHYLIFKNAGIEVGEVRVIGRGSSAHGHVFVPGSQNWDSTQQRLYLVGVLAGREGDLRWCDEFGLPRYPDRTCRDDRSEFRKMRRQMPLKGPAQGALQREARSLVRRHWPQILRLAPTLARRGHLAV